MCPIVEAARLLHDGGPWLAAELLAAESRGWALLHGIFLLVVDVAVGGVDPGIVVYIIGDFGELRGVGPAQCHIA